MTSSLPNSVLGKPISLTLDLGFRGLPCNLTQDGCRVKSIRCDGRLVGASRDEEKDGREEKEEKCIKNRYINDI